MKSIQVILIVLSLVAAVFGSVAFRSKLISRLIAAILLCLALVLITLPDLTTDLARTLGVGRGTDLLFYVVFFAGTHLFLVLYVRTRRLERKLTDSIRALAIRGAQAAEMRIGIPRSKEEAC